MNILVTGGAGYIGSVTNFLLAKSGFETVVLDDLSTGHREAAGKTPLLVVDLKNKKEVENVFAQNTFDAVVHFAALALAGESMERPYDYYVNNIVGTLNLLEAMRKQNCKFLVFSSTCAVYGTPNEFQVSETAPIHPESVYASSKRMVEEILFWYKERFGIESVSLRYFNASGAMLDGSLGESHDPETHIIPIAMDVAMGKREEFELYGNDYPTPDGTCIRDYIHVVDLADAHIKALTYLTKGGKSDVFNLGAGHGYSNNEIITTVEKVTGKTVRKKIAPRRTGDPAQIFADNTKAREVLGWEPKNSDLETIVASAWKWHQSHPNGFGV